MTKQEKQNNVKTVLQQIENAYRDMGEFLGKLKKTDKVELLDRQSEYTYTGILHPCIEDNEEPKTEFRLETKDNIVEFSIWSLALDRTYFDSKNNTLTLVIERSEYIIYK